MKKHVRIVASLCVSIALMASLSISASGINNIEANIYSSILAEIDIEESFIDDNSTRGNSPPSTSNVTTLPYGSSGPRVGYIYNYVFSNYNFKPKSNGSITTTFAGSMVSGNATVYVRLIESGTNKTVGELTLGPGTSWSNISFTVNNLNTNNLYHYQIAKTNGRAQSSNLSFHLREKA